MRSRHVVGLLTGSLAAVLSGCSAGPATTQAAAVRIDLGNAMWIGQCTGAEVGAYTFTFRPGNDQGGTVEIGTPEATADVVVPYTVTSADKDGRANFTMFSIPPWKGALQRDWKNLSLTYQVGDRPGLRRCDLQRAAQPQATS